MGGRKEFRLAPLHPPSIPLPSFFPPYTLYISTHPQVCSEWLGSSVSRNHGDLKRVQQLLISSLEKIKQERQQTSIYGEAVATMESLAVLNAWAEVRCEGEGGMVGVRVKG